MFAGIEANGDPAVGDGDEFAFPPEAEAVIGGVFEHLGEISGEDGLVQVGVEFVGEGDDGGAVGGGEFAKLEGVFFGHGGFFGPGHGTRVMEYDRGNGGFRCGSVCGRNEITKLVDIFH